MGVLAAAADGYNTLSSFYGPLEPNNEVICFNSEGKTKVWLNENLSLNDPSLSTHSITTDPVRQDSLLAERRAKECSSKLLDVVEGHIVNGYALDFKTGTAELTSFFAISNHIQSYADSHNLRIPETVSFSNLNRKKVLNTSFSFADAEHRHHTHPN